jgi:hypothetical protein
LDYQKIPRSKIQPSEKVTKKINEPDICDKERLFDSSTPFIEIVRGLLDWNVAYALSYQYTCTMNYRERETIRVHFEKI